MPDSVHPNFQIYLEAYSQCLVSGKKTGLLAMVKQADFPETPTKGSSPLC